MIGWEVINMEDKIFVKTQTEQKEIRNRNNFRKNLIKNLYKRAFEEKEMNELISFKSKTEGEDFETFLAYKVLDEQGYVNLFYDKKHTVPQDSYAVEITPKGILYYENL